MDHLHAFCEQLPDESTNQPPETQPVVTVEDDITDFDASDTIKRLMNQAIFEKFYIISNDEVELDIEFSFRPPFDKLLEPIKDDIAQINKNKSSNRIGNALTIAKGHIQEFLECGLSDVDNPSNMSTYSNDGYFFRHKSLSKVLLVEVRGIEPLSKSRPILGVYSLSCRIDLSKLRSTSSLSLTDSLYFRGSSRDILVPLSH